MPSLSRGRPALYIRLGTMLTLAGGCRTDRSAATSTTLHQPAVARYDPARDLGPLFHDVELSGIFPDSKIFVDARPLLPPSEIVARYAAARGSAGFSLRAFVQQYFDPPASGAARDSFRTDASQTMEQHIQALWPVL